jgi:hypothetical protein
MGIIINMQDHVCCLFICGNEQIYYNDNDKTTYKCNWKKILQKETTNDLYIENGKCLKFIEDINNYKEDTKLSKVLYLTVVSHNKNTILDTDIQNALNRTHLDTIIDRDIQYQLSINAIGKDNNMLHKMLYRSACQMYSPSLKLLAASYGSFELEPNPYAKVYMYYLAANKGNRDAMYLLGAEYMSGKILVKNYAEALRLYELSIVLGNDKSDLIKKLEELKEEIKKDAIQIVITPRSQIEIVMEYVKHLIGDELTKLYDAEDEIKQLMTGRSFLIVYS